MDEKRFWDILSVGCLHDVPPEDWGEPLEGVLRQLDPDDLPAFDRLFDIKTGAAYRRDLWSVANLINGGATDDGFYYFRFWLVGMGKQVYEAALLDPDTLADVVGPRHTASEYEAEIQAAARLAWRWHGLDEAEFDRAYDALGPRPLREFLGEWVEGDEFRRRFPRLAALYLSDEDLE